MRIALVSHSAGVAGAERSLVQLSIAAAELGHDVDVLLPKSGPIEGLLAAGGAPRTITYTGSHNWIGNRSRGLIGVVRLAQCLIDIPRHLILLKKLDPDLVVVNSVVSPAIMLAASLQARPMTVIVRESVFDNPKLYSALPKTVIRRLVTRWADGIVAISQYVGRDWPGSRVVWPPIEMSHMRTDEGSDDRPRRDADRSGSHSDARPLRVGMVGTIDPAKGQAILAKAVEKAYEDGANIECWIAGGGTKQDVASLRASVGDGIPVRLTVDWIDAAEVYRWSDLTVMCSSAEAFGKVTIESLLHETPVLAFRAGGTTEIAELGGIKLIEPTLDALAESLSRLAHDRSWSSSWGMPRRVDLIEKLKSNASTAIITAIQLAGAMSRTREP